MDIFNEQLIIRKDRPIEKAMKPKAISTRILRLCIKSSDNTPVKSSPNKPNKYGPIKIPTIRYAVTFGKFNCFTILLEINPKIKAILITNKI